MYGTHLYHAPWTSSLDGYVRNMIAIIINIIERPPSGWEEGGHRESRRGYRLQAVA